MSSNSSKNLLTANELRFHKRRQWHSDRYLTSNSYRYSHAIVVITDSGSVQEETTYLGVLCLILRSNTERPVTVNMGTNVLVGQGPAAAALRAGKDSRGRS
jgi:UDP-N-acetylglucosamine 2-epimerase